jgi:16S rRNA (cytidine1402-2'-O)-methyltransferase
MNFPPGLYIVGTPIGNLDDLTIRARDVLSRSDVVICEDTRVTGKLLAHLNIKKSLVSIRQRSLDSDLDQVLEQISGDQRAAYVTDAGMPNVADPGGRLVDRALKRGIGVFTVPGPSALTAAISVSGFPADQFLFLGFLPHKKGRQTLFKRIAETEETVVLYESPHRLIKTLESLMGLSPTRPIAVCRELTKIHESVVRGTTAEVLKHYQDHADEVRGEIVIIIGSKS